MSIMASMQMKCPNCGTTLAIKSEWAGMQVKCPQCNTAIKIPAQQAPQPGFQQPPPPPPPQPGFQQPPPPQSGFQQPGAVEEINMITALKKYAQFSGRARRKEYWMFFLFNFLINFVFNILSSVVSDSFEAYIVVSILSWIVSLGLLVPNISVAVRRLHDTGRSGWNYLWCLLPLVGWIILLVFYCQDSQPGYNQYGPNPKGY